MALGNGTPNPDPNELPQRAPGETPHRPATTQPPVTVDQSRAEAALRATAADRPSPLEGDTFGSCHAHGAF